MTPNEREQMNELCKKIQDEKDQAKFDSLVEELNQLLTMKEERLGKIPVNV